MSVSGVLYALDLNIVPLKKPILSKEDKEKKISKNILKPKTKPQKQLIITEKEITLNKIDGIIIPLHKPLIIKKEKKNYFKKN